MADLIRELKHRWRVRQAQREIAARLARPPAGLAHGLPWPVIVNVTSYPARFGTLHHTLASLLTQTVRADRTILWVAYGQARELSKAVRRLPDLDIRETADLRSYKKIIPAMTAWPDAALVTADDDVPYGPYWLEALVKAARPGEVAAHRTHRIRLGDGVPLPYAQWDRNIDSPERHPLIFPTGVGGVIYPPGTLSPDTLDRRGFERCAPTADDVWLWFMHRRTGAQARKIGRRMRVLEWPGSQTQSLRRANVAGDGNDLAMRAMAARYGWPLT